MRQFKEEGGSHRHIAHSGITADVAAGVKADTDAGAVGNLGVALAYKQIITAAIHHETMNHGAARKENGGSLGLCSWVLCVVVADLPSPSILPMPLVCTLPSSPQAALAPSSLLQVTCRQWWMPPREVHHTQTV